MSFITTYCHIDKKSCSVNGKVVGERDPESSDSWLKQLYKEQEFVYPKFYKMDLLSQAGFIATELIKRSNTGMSAYADDAVALLFANESSSMDTDLRFKRSYEEHGAPSPALFVYTLPNIVIGEIAILNKWYGENMFAVLPKFAPDFFVNYSRILMSTGSRAVLCGWLGNLGSEPEIFVFLVEENSENGIPLNREELQALSGIA